MSGAYARRDEWEPDARANQGGRPYMFHRLPV